MTFAQLRSFAMVARLGSVTVAARELGVSEPAVSAAIATLRREFGDELIVRGGGGVRLTEGGARLAAAANEILGLADRARRAVDEAGGAAAMLPIAATPEVAEFAAAPLIDAFARRAPSVEMTLEVAEAGMLAGLLADHAIDVALGPRPLPDPRRQLDSVPFLRYRLIVVAAPGHWLDGRRDVAPATLAGEAWLTGPSGVGQGTDVGDFWQAHSMEPDDVSAFPSFAAAAHAAAAGRGVMLAVAHTVMDDLRRGTLVRLDVRGTPIERLWHCTTIAADRRSPAAAALRRFVGTPEAVQAVVARTGDVPAARFRPPVHVTLWQG